MSTKQKWKLAKEETGQNSHLSPTLMREGDTIYTKPGDIAKILNRQYIQSIRDKISQIPHTDTNPLKIYSEYLGPIDTKLNIEQISMYQLTTLLQTMKPTTSSSADFISMRLIKDAAPAIKPLLLHLINTVIRTEVYPDILKLTKIVPIRKMEKPDDSALGWRPINIVPSISKVIEKTLLLQINNYLVRNNMINHTHHGSIQGKGTQTLVQELYDSMLELMEEGELAAVIQTDQSKAYDVVDH